MRDVPAADRLAEVMALGTGGYRCFDWLGGAAWHEREIAELFGIRFVGGD